MGRLSKMVLGEVRGKVGDIVVRVQNKKSIVYAKPKKVRVSQKPESKRARAKFTPASQFASFINSIPELKYFWGKSKVKACSVYHKIEKDNFAMLLHDRPTVHNKILPVYDGIFGNNPTRSLVLDKSGIGVTAKFEAAYYDWQNNEANFTSLAIICLYNPIKRWNKYIVFDKLAIDNIEIRIPEEFNFQIPFTEGALDKYYSYRNSIVYLTFITRDTGGIALRHCASYNAEFRHEYSEEEGKSIAKVQENKLRERIKGEIRGYFKKIFSGGRGR